MWLAISLILFELKCVQIRTPRNILHKLKPILFEPKTLGLQLELQEQILVSNELVLFLNRCSVTAVDL